MRALTSRCLPFYGSAFELCCFSYTGEDAAVAAFIGQEFKVDHYESKEVNGHLCYFVRRSAGDNWIVRAGPISTTG